MTENTEIFQQNQIYRILETNTHLATELTKTSNLASLRRVGSVMFVRCQRCISNCEMDRIRTKGLASDFHAQAAKVARIIGEKSAYE